MATIVQYRDGTKKMNYGVAAVVQEEPLDFLKAATIRRAAIDTVQLLKIKLRGMPVPKYMRNGKRPRGDLAEPAAGVVYGNLGELYDFFNTSDFEIFAKELHGPKTWLQLLNVYDGWRLTGFAGRSPIKEEDA